MKVSDLRQGFFIIFLKNDRLILHACMYACMTLRKLTLQCFIFGGLCTLVQRRQIALGGSYAPIRESNL